MPVKPGKYNPNLPDIELLDFMSKRKYGLKLDGNGGLKIGTVAQDDTVYVRNVGKRPGDFDEQRSWKGGRGIEDFSSNAEGYWDSRNAWTLTPGFLHQTLLWQFANGIVSHDIFMPDKTHSVTFKSLIGAETFLSISWDSSGVAAKEVILWLRKKGSPGSLTVEIRSNSSGDPSNSVLESQTLTAASIAQTLSVSKVIQFNNTETLTAATKYHLVITGAATDNKNNCWEIGGYLGGTTGKKSTTGSGSWTSAGFDLYYRVKATDIRRKWFSFFLDGAMYVVDSRDNQTTASRLWINGDRGKCTGSATSTTLPDTAKAWVVNRWTGAWVIIVRGKGRGQFRQIASNSTTALTIDSSDPWDVTPDNTSEFIIYSTKEFTEITSTGLGVVTGQPAVVNQIVFFPQGSASAIRTMVWNSASKAHDFDTNGSNFADLVCVGFHKTDGTQVWKALNSFASGGSTIVARHNAPAWASAPADLVIKETIQVGDKDIPITGIIEKDGAINAFKWDGQYIVSGFTCTRVPNGLEKTPDPANGASILIHQKFLYYSWLFSLIRVYGSEHDDIGQEWAGKGLPSGREGVVSSMDSYASVVFYAMDAGFAGWSSLLAFDGVGTHEVLRAYDGTRRMSMVKVQPCVGTRNFLWTGQGGDLVFQELPLKKGSPRLDTGVRYMHEAVLVSSKIDMGTAAGMPKFIRELTVVAENLNTGKEVYVEYQTDENVGTENWTPASSAYHMPESTIFLGLNNIRSFAYRLVLRSNDNTLPLSIRGVTPNGFARTPYKMVWTLRCRADNVTNNKKLAKSEELMRWLLDMSRFPYRVEMRSQYHMAHKFFVTVHPPSMFPYKPAVSGQQEESVFTLVLEEV